MLLPLGPGRIAAVAAAALLAGACIGVLLRLPDVSPLALENPRSTAYVRLYVQRNRSRGKRPVVMMRWVSLQDVSPHLRHAVIIAEDDMFYRHNGVDWDSLRRAAREGWRKGRWGRGASTITQQVARNLYLSPARHPLRKLKEILIAWKLERALTKDRILEIYLNIAEWGVGVYGAQAASQIYFGKDARDVSPEEAVALAAALPSPWRLNPAREESPRTAKKKEILLSRMRRAGYLPEDIPDRDVEVPDGLDVSSAPPASSSAGAGTGPAAQEEPDSCRPGPPGRGGARSGGGGVSGAASGSAFGAGRPAADGCGSAEPEGPFPQGSLRSR